MKKKVWDFLILNVALATLAIIGIVGFEPAKIVPGGVYGISLILVKKLFGNNVDSSYYTGRFSFFFNIPLISYGYVKFGKEYLKKTAYAALGFPIMTMVFNQLFSYYNIYIAFTDQRYVAIFFGIGMGICLAMAILVGGNTGGVDIVAQIVNDAFPFISVGTGITLINSLIILATYNTFGKETALWSLLSILLVGISVDATLYLFKKKED